MIEEIHRLLASVDDFAGIPRHGIHVHPLQTLPHSEVYRIRINSRANGFILKKPGVADVAGLAERERRFYRHIAPLLPDGLIPRCVLAVDDGQSKWLLIEDLSKTHRDVGDPSKPTLEECRGLAKALATLHGLTGADSTIREEWVKITADLPAASIDQRVAFFLTALGPFVAMLRSKVDRHVLEFLSSLGGISAPLAQAASGHQALVHGDAHFGNVLFSPGSSACLIDWGMPLVAFGEVDLAHALALNLPRDVARQWENEIVLAYLDQMANYGSDADSDTFYERYRLGVLYSLASPVIWWRTGVPESIWWPALTNAIDAARELKMS